MEYQSNLEIMNEVAWLVQYQKDLAEILSVAGPTISVWCTNQQRIDDAWILRLDEEWDRIVEKAIENARARGVLNDPGFRQSIATFLLGVNNRLSARRLIASIQT